MVENPALEIDRIKSFTNLTLNKFNQKTAWQRSQIDFSATSQAISVTQVNRYRQVLTESEISIIEQECADALQIFSY